MKIATIVVIAVVVSVLVYGTPFGVENPVLDNHYGSTERILPMTFAHVDHPTVSCIDCHHNYVDDTGNEPCMYCHVTNPEVASLLEDQFHTLCRGCHEDLAADNEAGGPPRQCIACHLADHLP